MIAFAQTAQGSNYAQSLVDRVNQAITFPLIALLLGVAVLMFLWGIFEMVRGAESVEARQNGQRHMLFGVIGIVVMLSALTLLQIAARTFGVTPPS